MKKSALHHKTILKALLILLTAVFVIPQGLAYAQAISVRSALVALGDTVDIPMEITGDVAGGRKTARP